MIAVKEANPLTVLLAGLCTVVLVVLVVEFQMVRNGGFVPDADAPDVAGESGGPGSTSSERVRLSPLSSYPDVLQRPLFTDTRRPPPTPAAGNASVQGAQLQANWKLTGVVVAGDASFAHVHGARSRQTQKITLGAVLDGWRVVEISSTDVTLSQGAETVVLQLRDEDGG